jgi:hypothetical protein
MPSLNTGNAILSNAIAVDSSYNVGIGGAASGSFKLQVTGTSNLTGTVTLATTSGVLAINTTGRPAGVGGGDNGKVWSKQATSGNYGIATIASATDSFTYIGHNGTDALLGTSYGTTGAYTDLVIQTADVTRFRLSGSTGAATFSNTGSASYGLTIANSSDNLRLRLGTTTGGYLNIQGQVTSSGNPFNISLQADGGNVGIGTSSPTAKLQIRSTSAGAATVALFLNNESASLNSEVRLAFGAHENSDISSNRYCYISALNTTASNGNALLFATNETGSSPAERMRITSGGNLCLNTTSTDERFTLNGAIKSKGSLAGYFFEDRSNSTYWYGWYSTGNTNVFFFNGNSAANIASISPSTGAYTALSDINKKKDFENSTIGLKEVLQLKPTLYRMKFDETNSSKELGFIAQEVKDFIPQAYVESEDFIGLNYNAIVAALVKSVQEQQAQIEELKAIVATK